MRTLALSVWLLLTSVSSLAQEVQAPINMAKQAGPPPEWQLLTQINASYVVASDLIFRAAMTVKVGDYFYGTMQFASENCAGRNLFRITPRQRPASELKEGLIANVGCVLHLFSADDTLYLLHRDGDKLKLSQLDNDQIVPARLSKSNQRGAANLLFRHHQRMLAEKNFGSPTTLFENSFVTFPGARGQRYWLYPPQGNKPWQLTEASSGQQGPPFGFTDIDPKTEGIEPPFPESFAASDFFDLTQDSRGNIYVLLAPKESDPESKLTAVWKIVPRKGVTSTFGGKVPVANFPETLIAGDWSVREGRFLAGGRKGFVISERHQTPDEDFRRVFYVDGDTEQVYRVPIEATDISGISFVNDCLLVTRPNARRIVLYGTKDAECFRTTPQVEAEKTDKVETQKKEGKHVLD